MHLHLSHANDLLATAGGNLVVAGKVTHGIGAIVKFLIGFGILIGVVAAAAVFSLMKKK
jgi:hypothetical protein